MKRIPNWIIITLVIGILIAVKLLFFNKNKQVAAGGKGKAAGPVAVNYHIVSIEPLNQQVYTTGKIGALNEVEIRPEVSGKVVEIFFREGDQVSKGQQIIKINDADLQAQLAKNKIQIRLAGEKLDRLKKLMEVKGVSQEEVDVQNNEYEALKADQAFIMAQLDKTTITAPFTGIIGLKNISEGAYVSPLQVIASLVQVHPLFIEFSVPEKYSATMRKGMNINFTSESDRATHTAQIYAIEPRIDEVTKTLRGRALYSGKETFYPGAFVKVFVDLGKSESVMIPTQSLIPVLKGQKVFVNRSGVAAEVMVTSGVRTEDKIQILEGLQPGDTVLTTGLMSVKKDSKLKLIKAGN